MKTVVAVFFVSAAVLAGALSAQASACITLATDLRYRATDRATKGSVTPLQNFLVAAGYLKVAPTGYFGPATLRAVQAFQRANRLYAAGFVGPQTRAKLRTLTCVPEKAVSPERAPHATSTASGQSAAADPGRATSTAGFSASAAAQSASGGFAAPAEPDAKAAYLATRAEYDAAPTLAAFIEVSARYASASRAGDVAAQRNFLNELSAEERADFLNATIRGIVPSASEIDSVGIVVSGSKATLLVIPRAASGKDAKGLVTLILEGGAWKLEREQWQRPDGSGIEPLPSSSGG